MSNDDQIKALSDVILKKREPCKQELTSNFVNQLRALVIKETPQEELEASVLKNNESKWLM